MSLTAKVSTDVSLMPLVLTPSTDGSAPRYSMKASPRTSSCTSANRSSSPTVTDARTVVEPPLLPETNVTDAWPVEESEVTRRQFAIDGRQNSDGSGMLTTRGIDVGGVFVYRAPQAAVALQYNDRSYQAGEKSPMQVASTNVELFGRDVGIGGATVNVHWPAGIYSYEI